MKKYITGQKLKIGDNMLDFLFINSPTNASNPHIPYHLLYLISYLEKKGYKCKLIDPCGFDGPNHMKKHIGMIINELTNNPTKFIGIPIFHSDYDMAMELAFLAKKLLGFL